MFLGVIGSDKCSLGYGMIIEKKWMIERLSVSR